MKLKMSIALTALATVALTVSPSFATESSGLSDRVEVMEGQVLVRPSEDGLVIGVDTDSPADGFVNHAFLYQMEQAPSDALRFEGDGVLWVRADRLVVTSKEGDRIVDLRLADKKGLSGVRLGDEGESASILYEGIGLSRYGSLSTVTLEQLGGFDPAHLSTATWLSDNPFARGPVFEGGGETSCPAGGTGSSGCSIPSCCSVSCSSGYYACCHCSNGCKCVSTGGGGEGIANE